MLTIKTVKNPLVSDSKKDGFCFRSSCSQNLDINRLAEEMADYNSSFTVADNKGMLSVLDTIVVKYLSKGYNVELPFGFIRANATGTCPDIQSGFVPGSGNNQLGFLFSASEETLSRVKSKIEYRQLPPDITSEAKIYRVGVLQKDASENFNLTVTAGNAVRIHGRNLSFDIDDSQQGVFLENESGTFRLETYNRRGTNIVEVVVPPELTAGKYSMSVVTKPGNTYFTATTDSEITVS